MTDSGVLAAKFDILPTEVAAVCEALPGMLIHRDMAAFLYGVILSPKPEEELSKENVALVDRVAALTLAGNDAFSEVRETYGPDYRVRVPPTVFNALRNTPESIRID
jgi:hypothetical protein